MNMEQNQIKGLGRALFQEAGDALFLFDPDNDRLMAVNPIAERLTGLDRQALLAKPMTYWFRFSGKGKEPRARRLPQRDLPLSRRLSSPHQQGRRMIPINITIARLHIQPEAAGAHHRPRHPRTTRSHAQLQAKETELRRCWRRFPTASGCRNRRGWLLGLLFHVARRSAHYGPVARDVSARWRIRLARRRPCRRPTALGQGAGQSASGQCHE